MGLLIDALLDLHYLLTYAERFGLGFRGKAVVDLIFIRQSDHCQIMRESIPRLMIWLWIIIAGSNASFAHATTVDDKITDEGNSYFKQRVEPLLQQRCYGCHSHAAELMEGGLSLDWQSGWKTGGARGPAIVPGKPEESLLIRAIQHDDPELQMPEERLPQAEIDVLIKWIQQGAHDPRTAQPVVADPAAATDWWSLRPLERPVVPQSDCNNPIDAFVQRRLLSEGRTPSPAADRRTLIRRLMFDLHGLPPTPEEVAAFESDSDPGAWEKLIDRLLASPRYGERWARHWLDTIHFADTHGFEHDAFRPNAWRFRDYVIDSLNRDTPWTRFIREQLATDVFYPDQTQLTPALGFLGAGPYDHSAAVTAPMSFENLDRDDMVTQTMGAFASTTAACARCHAHKFDPIPQADYYALQAVFAGIGKGDISFDADPQTGRQRVRWQTLQAAAKQRDASVLLLPEYTTLVSRWESRRLTDPGWRRLDIDVFLSAGGATLKRMEDGSILSTGTRPDKETVTIIGTTTLDHITAIRLDVLTDESLPLRGPGRMDNGNLHLSEIVLQVFFPGANEAETLAVSHATADFDQSGWTIQHAIDGDLKTAWGIHPAVSVDHHAVFELAEPLVAVEGMKIAVIMKQLHGGGHVIGRCQVSVTAAEPASVAALPADAEAVLAVPADQRTTEQQTTLAAALLNPIAASEIRRLPAPAKVYTAAAQAENERGVVTFGEPRQIRLLKRGDVQAPGETVAPGSLSAVKVLPARFELPDRHHEAQRRAALADWIADAANPLTWRSAANRIWHYHFGRGLCDTPNDFGRMGSRPSHPELLDWLACEFRDSSGSVKHLHRLICMSQTYQQTSAQSEELLRIDPENRLLGRMSRQRLDADCFRDAVLAVSGRLDLSMGGPAIQHFSTSPGPQLTPVLDYNDFDWDGIGAGRRSIYRVVWRGITDPLMEALDFPDLGLLAPSRGFSASALQSLVLLNNRFVLHHAKHMTARAESVNGQLPEQIEQLVQWAWQRHPSSIEQQQLESLAVEHGLSAVCRLLLNSNEFLFVE